LFSRTMDALVTTKNAQARQEIARAFLIETEQNIYALFGPKLAQVDLDTKAVTLETLQAQLQQYIDLGPTVVETAKAELALTIQRKKESEERIKLAYLERGDKVAAQKVDEAIRWDDLELRRVLGHEELTVRREETKAQTASATARGKESRQTMSERDKADLRKEAFDTYRAYLANPTQEDLEPTQETLDYALRQGAITSAEHRQWTGKINAARKPSR